MEKLVRAANFGDISPIYRCRLASPVVFTLLVACHESSYNDSDGNFQGPKECKQMAIR